MQPVSPRVGLFVTCLVDLMRPSVGFAAVKLLERAGCRVEVPVGQVCCGQPAYNAGDRAGAAAIARDIVRAFEGFDYVVAPSGSCAGMIKLHYAALLGEDNEYGPRAAALAGRTYELTQFLVDVRGPAEQGERWPAKTTYHDSCSCLRELGVKDQPRRLLAGVEGLALLELPEAEACCGFGGAFAVKYPQISDHIVAAKAAAIASTGAELLLAADLGCLLNIAGKLRRDGRAIEVRHIAEVLAGMSDSPAIGEGTD
jgi:L-lactate dehydrogenase complex protein LldE